MTASQQAKAKGIFEIITGAGLLQESIHWTDFKELFLPSIQFLHDQSHTMPDESKLSWKIQVDMTDETQRIAHEIASCDFRIMVSGRLSACKHGQFGDPLFKGLPDGRIEITVRKRN